MRRLSFWGAVGGVSILANLLFQVATDKANLPGLSKVAAYKNRS